VDPIIRFADSTLIIAHWYNLQLSDTARSFQLQHVRELEAATAIMTARHPGGFAGLSFARQMAQPSEKATRDELTRFLRSLRDRPITRSVTVFEGSGVMASTIRTVGRAMMAISGYHIEIAATTNEAIRRIMSHIHTSDGQMLSRPELEAAIKFVRDAIDAKQPAVHAPLP
jgi:hypothetical protein